MQISKGRINRLGDSIRDGTLSAEDVEILHEMRSRWVIAGFQLRRQLLDIFEQTEFEVTSRIKNMGTLREKLMRTNLRLSGIRDVVIAMSEEQRLPDMGNIESVLMKYKVLVNEIRRGIG